MLLLITLFIRLKSHGHVGAVYAQLSSLIPDINHPMPIEKPHRFCIKRVGSHHQKQKTTFFINIYTDVSENNATPKSCILIGFSGFPLFSPSILGETPVFLETPNMYIHNSYFPILPSMHQLFPHYPILWYATTLC